MTWTAEVSKTRDLMLLYCKMQLAEKLSFNWYYYEYCIKLCNVLSNNMSKQCVYTDCFCI